MCHNAESGAFNSRCSDRIGPLVIRNVFNDPSGSAAIQSYGRASKDVNELVRRKAMCSFVRSFVSSLCKQYPYSIFMWPTLIPLAFPTAMLCYLFLFPTLQACEPAARMALNDVNSNPTLLPGYQLKLHWNDSGVSGRQGE